jgi:hypothetical protein
LRSMRFPGVERSGHIDGEVYACTMVMEPTLEMTEDEENIILSEMLGEAVATAGPNPQLLTVEEAFPEL